MMKVKKIELTAYKLGGIEGELNCFFEQAEIHKDDIVHIDMDSGDDYIVFYVFYDCGE